jgi:DNA-binding MarR family transcriptional regulator
MTPVTGTPWLDDEEQETWRTLLRHALLMLDHLDGELRQAHDLGLADYEILVQLSEADGQRLRMSELADQALVSRSRLTHRVDRMVDAGLVGRERCPTDRRGVEAVLTPAGRERLIEAAPTHVAGVRRYVIDPLDRPTQRALVAQLEPVVEELEAGGVIGACAPDD